MARILWLADALRSAGLTVVEHAGWQTRERSGDWTPRFGVVHATAAPRTQSDETQIRIVRDGRSDLPGPIANACVDRQGRWHVLAAGRCNTTLSGTAGPFAGMGNAYALGVEACNDNAGEPWPAIQYASYCRGEAAICDRMGWTERNLVGHREHTPGHKTDPTFSMTAFRAEVADILSGDDVTPAQFLAILRDPDVAAMMSALPWQYGLWGRGGLPAGASSALSSATQTHAAVAAILQAVPADLAARLGRIETAANDDGDVTVQMDDAARAELTAIKTTLAAIPAQMDQLFREIDDAATAELQAAIAAVPAAVVDEERERLTD